MVGIGATSAACGLDWAVMTDDSGISQLPDASNDSEWGVGDGGLSGPGQRCSSKHACNAATYCSYPDKECGKAVEGVCQPRPDACNEAAPPQCGCDGKRYTMACEAHRAGFDDGPDACSPNAPEYFACGTSQCRVGAEYCVVQGLLAVYSCQASTTCSTACSSACQLSACAVGLGTCFAVAGGGIEYHCNL